LAVDELFDYCDPRDRRPGVAARRTAHVCAPNPVGGRIGRAADRAV
jgi:hypothetical protein